MKQLQAKLRGFCATVENIRPFFESPIVEQDAAATGLNVGAFTNIMNNRAAKRAAVMDFGGDKIKIGANFVPKVLNHSRCFTKSIFHMLKTDLCEIGNYHHSS